jgi:hypothetical protein
MDNGRASDPERVNVTARQTRGDRCADVPLPNDGTGKGVERINIIGFGHDNNSRPTAWTALDVKRLRVNIA